LDRTSLGRPDEGDHFADPASGGTIVELFHHGYDLIGGDPAEYFSGFERGWDTHHLDALAAIVAA
jgi:hypothetical protein